MKVRAGASKHDEDGRAEVRDPARKEERGRQPAGGYTRVDANVVDRHQHADDAADNVQRHQSGGTFCHATQDSA